jgi:hypothetical protein
MLPAQAETILVRRRVLVLAGAVLTSFAASAGAPAFADDPPAYDVEVDDVTAKVGEHVVMLATLKIRDGYRILPHYNNRVIKLSSFDDGVAFERDPVPAELQEGALVFNVGLRPTKPGKHPINGLFRVGYIHGTDEMAMVSMRLIANVTGTE